MSGTRVHGLEHMLLCTIVGGAAHMPELAEEYASLVTDSLRDWLPGPDLLWGVHPWDVWVAVAFLQG